MQTSDVSKMGKILKNCVIKGKKPTKVWFEVTDRCNSHCKSCGIWKKLPTPDHLTPEEIYKVFSDPYLSDVEYIILAGGEPMMREDIFDVVMAINRALPGVAMNFSTNGLTPILTAMLIEDLLDNGVNLSVGTSIDAIGSTHDRIRGTKLAWLNVAMLMNSLKKLRDRKYPDLKIGFGTVLQKENQDQIEEIKKYAERNGFFYLLQYMDRSDFYGLNHPLYPDYDKEVEVIENLPERFNMLKEKWLDHLHGKSIKFKCYALKDFFALRCNGDVVPCLHHWDDVRGNIRHHSIEWILSHESGRVKNCSGCLNSWGTYWSWEAHGWPYVYYYIKRPIKLVRKLCGLYS